MKVGDLVNHTFLNLGVGIIREERSFGGWVVWFPHCDMRCSDKLLGVQETHLKVIK